MTSARIRTVAARRQRGVYAVEYAVVFLIFFTLLYAIICYGVIFALRFSMQNAAEDGARAALRYQATVGQRATEAASVAQARLFSSALASAKICVVAANSDACGAPTYSSCNAGGVQRCRVFVTVIASDLTKMLPPLPSFAVPDKLAVQASMMIDGRTL